MTADNPIAAAIAFLEDRGFTNTEARNLCAAIRADSAEKLWDAAPLWIEWCAKIKLDYDCIVSLAAQGILRVEIGPGGIEDLLISLNTPDTEAAND